MPKKPKQQVNAEVLLAAGWREDRDYPSRKYRVFVRAGHDKVFLGRAGAVRVGKTASDSLSVPGVDFVS